MFAKFSLNAIMERWFIFNLLFCFKMSATLEFQTTISQPIYTVEV